MEEKAKGVTRCLPLDLVRTFQPLILVSKEKESTKACRKNKVTLDYRVGELETLQFQSEEFDAVALIYAHFQAENKSFYHKALNVYLRKGGIVIFEAFSKKHLEYISKMKSRWTRDIQSLFSIDEIKSDFANYEVIELIEKKLN